MLVKENGQNALIGIAERSPWHSSNVYNLF